MDDSITFEAVFVTVMKHITIVGISIYTQIPYAKRLKQQAHCFQIIQQIIRSQTQCGNSDGWINEIASITGSYRCL